jgi:hypothetical protein
VLLNPVLVVIVDTGPFSGPSGSSLGVVNVEFSVSSFLVSVPFSSESVQVSMVAVVGLLPLGLEILVSQSVSILMIVDHLLPSSLPSILILDVLGVVDRSPSGGPGVNVVVEVSVDSLDSDVLSFPKSVSHTFAFSINGVLGVPVMSEFVLSFGVSDSVSVSEGMNQSRVLVS